MQIELKVLLLDPTAAPPMRQRAGDAAYDVRCARAFELAPGERKVIGSGFALAIPDGVAGLLLPRSGIASKHGVTLVNSPGLIDSGYRGEVGLALINLSAEPFAAQAGERIAQLLLVPHLSSEVSVCSELPSSADGRGANGFGSSGR